jgi:predicted  nucleic acid-binding Zn-ribbon protein
MRTVARCKRCGTEFPLVGEVSGCPNCKHDELECFPKDPIEELIEEIPDEELVAFAEDMAKIDEDPFITELMKENSLTQAFLEELNAELDQIELPKRVDGGETPYEKGQRLLKEAKKGRSPLRSGSAFSAAQEIDDELEKAVAEAIGLEEKPKTPRSRDPKLDGFCRKCVHWNKMAPQAGACRMKAEGVNVTMWFDVCPSFRLNPNYAAQQVEIREKRKAHDSILRAMERSRT